MIWKTSPYRNNNKICIYHRELLARLWIIIFLPSILCLQSKMKNFLFRLCAMRLSFILFSMYNCIMYAIVVKFYERERERVFLFSLILFSRNNNNKRKIILFFRGRRYIPYGNTHRKNIEVIFLHSQLFISTFTTCIYYCRDIVSVCVFPFFYSFAFLVNIWFTFISIYVLVCNTHTVNSGEFMHFFLFHSLYPHPPSTLYFVDFFSLRI